MLMTVQSDQPESVLGELKRYVGFSEADETALAGLQGPAADALDDLIVRFYRVIDQHEDAAAVFTEAESQKQRLRETLRAWTRSLLRGPYDEAYAAKRMEIGRAHVRVNLPQRYMLTAMNVVRRWFTELCFARFPEDRTRLSASLDAVDRILDIELALMLGTYRDDMLARIQRQERLATIGELSAGIHHELKNPLAAIGTMVFALSERRALQADPRARDMLARIRSNIDKSNVIIRDLLSFTRLRDPVVEPTPADALVDRVKARVLLPRSCKLTVDLDPDLPDVRADAGQVEQVLVNLLENAVDACASQGGQIRISGRRSGDSVRFAVIDDGVGIGPHALRRVFEPLFSTKTDGVGLGLSLSKHLVQANGGELTLVSTLGEGTSASLVLPT